MENMVCDVINLARNDTDNTAKMYILINVIIFMKPLCPILSIFGIIYIFFNIITLTTNNNHNYLFHMTHNYHMLTMGIQNVSSILFIIS